MTRRIRKNSHINRKSYPRRTKGKKRKSQNRKITKKRNSYRTRKYKYRKLHSGGSLRGSMRGSCCAAPSLSPRRPTQPSSRRVASPRMASPRMTAQASPRVASPRMTAQASPRMAPPPAVISPPEPAPAPAPAVHLTPRTQFRQRQEAENKAWAAAAWERERREHPGAYRQEGTAVPLPTLTAFNAGHVSGGYAPRDTDLQGSLTAAASKKAVRERAKALPVRAEQLDAINQVMRQPLGEPGTFDGLPNEALAAIAAEVRQARLPPASVVAAAQAQAQSNR
jgi:hypothetical protein